MNVFFKSLTSLYVWAKWLHDLQFETRNSSPRFSRQQQANIQAACAQWKVAEDRRITLSWPNRHVDAVERQLNLEEFLESNRLRWTHTFSFISQRTSHITILPSASVLPMRTRTPAREVMISSDTYASVIIQQQYAIRSRKALYSSNLRRDKVISWKPTLLTHDRYQMQYKAVIQIHNKP